MNAHTISNLILSEYAKGKSSISLVLSPYTDYLLPRLADNGLAIFVFFLFFECVFRGGDFMFAAMSKEYRANNQSKKLQWRLRLVSLAHALLTAIGCLGIINDPIHQQNKLDATTPWAELVISISCGYFMHDLLQCILCFSVQGWDFLIHAILAQILILENFAPVYMYYGGWFLLYEWPTVCLNIGWFAEKMGYKLASKLFFVLFFLTFLGIRVIGGTIQTPVMISLGMANYANLKQGQRYWIWSNAILGTSLVLLNLYWFSAILKTAAKKLGLASRSPHAASSRKDSGAHLLVDEIDEAKKEE